MSKNGLALHADDLRAMGEDVVTLLTSLQPSKAAELRYTWAFWARPNQLPPTIGNNGKKWNNWLILAGRGFGKDVAKTTPILTTVGFKAAGDVKIGDSIYSWDGTPTKVVDLYEPLPRKLIEFTFSDGTTLITSIEHEWVTWTHQNRKCFGRNFDKPIPEDWVNWSFKGKGSRVTIAPTVKTTQEICDTFTHGKSGDLNHSIPLPRPLLGSHVDVVKDAYYLGLWLGDGISKSCHEIACGDEDRDWLLSHYPQFGYRGNLIYRAPTTQFQWMRDLGLRGNKHLPEAMLVASFEQRLSCLQGLMDSDGYVGHNNHVEFCSTKEVLADAVVMLARSLGQKPVLTKGSAKLYGKDCGPKYRVTWRPTQYINPFRLPRKASRVSFGGKQESRNYHRMIVSFKEVPYEPTVCFSVDHKDHLFLAGEGLIPTHNTRSGAEWVREQVKRGVKRIACVAPTNSDIKRVMVEGESGFLAICWENDKTYKGVEIGKPVWSPTNRTLVWANGAKVEFYSAEEPERLRGPQFEAAWCDEICAWARQRETWDMLQFTLRLGSHPRVCLTTTPKSDKLIREILANPTTAVTYGSTFDNSANLADTYLTAVAAQYEGTRLGRQELYAEILDEAAGALWNRELLEKCEVDIKDPVDFAQQLNRVVVSLDPAVTANAESDMTGIIVAGVDSNGTAYVLEDCTDRYTPEGWASKAIDLYNKYSADRIVAEVNQGGDMVRHTLHTIDDSVPYRAVRASRGKMARAEPVSALYERGLVKHVRGLDELENQMVQWEPLGSIGSPDRLDSLVWAITDLCLGGIVRPELNLAYKSKGLL